MGTLRPTWFPISNFSSQVMWSAFFKSPFLLVALFWHFLYHLSKKLEVAEVEKKLQWPSSASTFSNQGQLGQAAQEGIQFLITSIWRLHSLAVVVFSHSHKKGFLWVQIELFVQKFVPVASSSVTAHHSEDSGSL